MMRNLFYCLFIISIYSGL